MFQVRKNNCIKLRSHFAAFFMLRANIPIMSMREFTSKNKSSLSSGYSSLESSIQKRESLRSMKVKMSTTDTWG